MYTLTLTVEERKAIDFVGHRYSNGDQLYHLLWGGCTVVPDDRDWDADGALAFHVPEHVAWQIKDNAEEEDGYWPLFSTTLADKMQSFVDSII